jgi:hypothetical protein
MPNPERWLGGEYLHPETQVETAMVQIIHQVNDVVNIITISELQEWKLLCHGCYQVGYLLRNCPNAAREPNPSINNAFMGNTVLHGPQPMVRI